jgi:hypothetical protein
MTLRILRQAALLIVAALIVGLLTAGSPANAASAPPAHAASQCPFDYGARAHEKPSRLFLFFPAQNLPNPFPPIPSKGFNNKTKWLPMPKFDPVRDLAAHRGTETDLREGILDVVKRIYCEFNVHVEQTSRIPTSADGPRRNTIAIGTDVADNRGCTDPLRGQAKVEGGDTGDGNPVDFARVWAGVFQACATKHDQGLDGTNSTTQRWAESIGSTAAHEAGHNFGLSHDDGFPLSLNEDRFRHHLMRRGAAYNWKERAEPRHFSDFEYSILANNVGLAMDTMWGWDLTNPNSGPGPNAAKLRMELLSVSPSLILSWPYSGNRSPWINPTLRGPLASRAFKGVNYHVYQIEWSTGQPWTEGQYGSARPIGEVPNQARFHVGATFSSLNHRGDPESVIITDMRLLDASNNALPQQPRWFAADAATFNQDDGLLKMQFHNVSDRPLMLRDVVVRDLPRIVSVNSMTADLQISDMTERTFEPWPDGTRRPLDQQMVAAGQTIAVEIGNVRKPPYVIHKSAERDCAPRKDPDQPVGHCQPAKPSTDPFPSTTTYITATIVDPQGPTLDPNSGQPVTGPVETRLFYQLAGRRVPVEIRIPSQPSAGRK